MAFEHVSEIIPRVLAKAAAGLPEPVILVLPEPPSSNRYWRQHGHITYRTREAKEYIELVGGVARHAVGNGGPTFPDQELAIVLVWHRGRKAGDLDNRSKVLYDALQGVVYADDKQIAQDWRRRCDEHPTIPKGHVRIEVCPIA